MQSKRITAPEIEKVYTTKEVAAMLRLSDDTVRRTFQDRPGVLKFGKSFRRGKRGYVTIRIPESVLKELYAEVSQ